MLIYQGKLSGILSKGRYVPLSHFSFHETKECIPHKAQTVIFFPALQGRNKAARDSHFWLDSTNTIPFFGNTQKNSQRANENFALLLSIFPLKEGFMQGHSSNSVHPVFTAGFQRSFCKGRETGHASAQHFILPVYICQILFPTVT